MFRWDNSVASKRDTNDGDMFPTMPDLKQAKPVGNFSTEYHFKPALDS